MTSMSGLDGDSAKGGNTAHVALDTLDPGVVRILIRLGLFYVNTVTGRGAELGTVGVFPTENASYHQKNEKDSHHSQKDDPSLGEETSHMHSLQIKEDD